MSTHDVAASIRRAAQQSAAVPALIDALERMLNRDDDARQVAERALAAAGRPWDQQRYAMRRNLQK